MVDGHAPGAPGDECLGHITAVDAVGTEDLWVVLEDVPGLVPFGRSVDGSDRGEGVDRSTDGGRTWTFGAVPVGCLQTCGPISLHFVDRDHGFGATSLNGGSGIATKDGGGVRAAASIAARTAGHTWSTAEGLAAGAQYSLPVFFGGDSGVVLAVGADKGDQRSMAYVTDNGGATWEPHRIPSFRGAGFQGGSLQSRSAAVGPLAWRIDVGPHLYETTNGCRSWTNVRPVPPMGLGNVWGLAFSSPDNGRRSASRRAAR